MKNRIISLVLALVMCLMFSQLDVATATEQDFLDMPPIDESMLEQIEGSPYEQRVASEHIFWIEHDGSTGTTKVVGEYRAEDDDNGELESPPYNPEETAVDPGFHTAERSNPPLRRFGLSLSCCVVSPNRRRTPTAPSPSR